MKIESKLTWIGTVMRDGDPGENEEWPDIFFSARFMLRVTEVEVTFVRTEGHKWELDGTIFTGQKYLKVSKKDRDTGVLNYGSKLLPEYHWVLHVLLTEAANYRMRD